MKISLNPANNKNLFQNESKPKNLSFKANSVDKYEPSFGTKTNWIKVLGQMLKEEWNLMLHGPTSKVEIKKFKNFKEVITTFGQMLKEDWDIMWHGVKKQP